MNARITPLVLLLTTAGSAFGQGNDPFSDPNAIPSRTVRVEIRDTLEISVGVPGMLRHAAKLGDKISKGEVVVKLDDKLVRAQYEEAKAKAEADVLIKYAEIKRDTAEIDLNDKLEANRESGRDLFTESEIRRARLDLEQGEAEVKKANHDQFLAQLAQATKEEELPQFEVESEIDGIVTKVERRTGEFARQGDPILTITNTDVLRAVLDVDPRYELRFNVGDKVYLRARKGISRSESTNRPSLLAPSASQGPTRTPASEAPKPEKDAMIFEGTIILVAPALEGSPRSVEVTADIQNRRDSAGRDLLKDGQTVDAVIIGAD